MSTAERKEREKQRRRNEIIDAAEKLFFSKGYENVTMDDIAKETDLARGTLYLYFKNKDEIYTPIITRGARIQQRLFKEACQGEKTGLEKARALIMAYNEFYRKYPGYFRANWYSQMPRPNDGDMSDMTELISIRRENFRMVVDTINQGMNEGTLREGLDPVKTTLFLTLSMQNALNLTPGLELMMKVNDIKHEELVDYTIDLLVYALGNKET